MKHSIFVKFIAIALCALSLVAVVGVGLGIVLASEQGLYANTPEEVLLEQQRSIGMNIAYNYAQRYAIENLGNLPQELIDYRWNYSYDDYYAINYNFTVEIYQDGACIHTLTSNEPENANVYEYYETPNYAIITGAQTYYYNDYTGTYDETPPETGASITGDFAVAAQSLGEPLYTDLLVINGVDEYGNEYYTEYQLEFYSAPEYRIVVSLDGDTSYNDMAFLLFPLYQYRFHLIGAVVIGLLLFAVTLVYLCCAAGRRAGTTEVRPMGLNRVPLDLYAVVVAVGCGLLIWGAFEIFNGIMMYEENWALLSLVALCCFCAALLVIGLIFAFSAQVKSKGGYWWRHMICGWILTQIGKFFRWLGRGLVWCRRGIREVFNLLPVIWQWLLTAAGMALALLFTFFCFVTASTFWQAFWFVVMLASLAGCVAIICYGGYCFGTLLKGAKFMAQGHLDHQIPTKHLYASFKDFGNQLNNLAEGAKIAAERQMKSERMKTELITNVSHDIKTPLTSIINYVDLMKMPHSEAENAQYLEVLDRQSQRLKKLIDDLMEMSKASTGNLTVEMGQVDALEAVNQALGEFSDKLASVNLTPVVRHPEEPVVMRADGRLVWRVMSNLLSNAVKYALPDTRLYIDLMILQGNAVIAIKNISRDQLNVNADELMERFVRGDSSRNTEGSGLGLNIVRSLVELQQGQMHLMVDGDLFKVTLIFPLA